MRPRTILLLILLCVPLLSAHAEDLIWITGKVISEEGKLPIAGAIVAAYDDKNRVVDYAKTDSIGVYCMVVPRNTLHLEKKDGGFLHTVVSSVGGMVGGTAGALRSGIRAAASAFPIADPITKLGVNAASGLAQALAGSFPGGKGNSSNLRTQPGALVMKVSAPGHNDAISIARVYWMEQQIYHNNGRDESSLAAWIDPARMATGSQEKKSQVSSDYLTFTDSRIEPGIAEKGQTVTLSVVLSTPLEPPTPIVVVARNVRGRIWQLTPTGNNIWSTQITVDKSFPANDQTICVLAYAEKNDIPGRSKKTEDAINRAGLWNPGKVFVYNPLLVASRNRADLTLTVVSSGR